MISPKKDDIDDIEKEGPFKIDTREKLQEIAFWHDDKALIAYEKKKQKSWKVTLRNLNAYDAGSNGYMVNLLNELNPNSNFGHVIWAFCFSADATNSDTKTVTQHIIAKRNLKVEKVAWEAPTFPGVLKAQ